MATKAQLARIEAVLESEEYGTVTEMAKAVMKEVGLILSEVDGWVALTRIPVKSGFPFEIWGPFANKTEANKLKKVFDNVAFLPIKGTASLDDRERSVTPVSNDKQCEKCDHPQFAHLNGTKTRDGCKVSGCTCKMTYGVYKK